jgi:hypothetical protein
MPKQLSEDEKAYLEKVKAVFDRNRNNDLTLLNDVENTLLMMQLQTFTMSRLEEIELTLEKISQIDLPLNAVIEAARMGVISDLETFRAKAIGALRPVQMEVMGRRFWPEVALLEREKEDAQ